MRHESSNRHYYQWFLRFLLPSAMSLLLSACHPQTTVSDTTDEYRQRIANVLDVEVPTVTTPPMKLIRSAPIELERLTIKMSEWMGLEDCQVDILVAQQNTPLARVQGVAHQYHYEVELLRLFEQCSLQYEGNQKLQKIINKKRDQRGQHWRNLVQTENAWISATTLYDGPLQEPISDGLAETESALRYFIQIRDNQTFDLSELHSHLQSLQDYRLLIDMWRTQWSLRHQLTATTQWLTEITAGLRCTNSIDKTKIDYLKNINQQFFIERLQETASHVNHYQYRLADELQVLIEHPDLDSEFKQYLALHTVTEFEAFQQSLKEHVMAWQTVFSVCSKLG